MKEIKETFEEAAENYVRNEPDATLKLISKYSFKDGAEWQQERMYSEEEVKEIIIDAINSCTNGVSSHCQDFEEWFEENKNNQLLN